MALTPGVDLPFRKSHLLYFLALNKASREPWDVSLHSGVWARALGFAKPNAPAARSRLSKTWSRLVERRLVTRTRKNRLAQYTSTSRFEESRTSCVP
jgi:hypothetical protein